MACARRFGWIGTEDLLSRMEATLATMHKLDRHHGHFLNWYDTQTLAPLLPMYLSTVDSGNLCGHLLAVSQSCRELAAAPYDRAALLHALKASKARLTPLLSKRSTLSQYLRDELTWLLADHRTTSTKTPAKMHKPVLETPKTHERLQPRHFGACHIL